MMPLPPIEEKIKEKLGSKKVENIEKAREEIQSFVELPEGKEFEDKIKKGAEIIVYVVLQKGVVSDRDIPKFTGYKVKKTSFGPIKRRINKTLEKYWREGIISRIQIQRLTKKGEKKRLYGFWIKEFKGEQKKETRALTSYLEGPELEKFKAIFNYKNDPEFKEVKAIAVADREEYVKKKYPHRFNELIKFYNGGTDADWVHIYANLDVRRQNKEEEIYKSLEAHGNAVIKARAGQGKSTLMFRFAFEHRDEFEVLEVRTRNFDEDKIFDAIRILKEILQRLNKKILIIVNDLARCTNWGSFIEETIKLENVYLLAAIREETWNTYSLEKLQTQLKLINLEVDKKFLKRVLLQMEKKGVLTTSAAGKTFFRVGAYVITTSDVKGTFSLIDSPQNTTLIEFVALFTGKKEYFKSLLESPIEKLNYETWNILRYIATAHTYFWLPMEFNTLRTLIIAKKGELNEWVFKKSIKYLKEEFIREVQEGKYEFGHDYLAELVCKIIHTSFPLKESLIELIRVLSLRELHNFLDFFLENILYEHSLFTQEILASILVKAQRAVVEGEIHGWEIVKVLSFIPERKVKRITPFTSSLLNKMETIVTHSNLREIGKMLSQQFRGPPWLVEKVKQIISSKLVMEKIDQERDIPTFIKFFALLKGERPYSIELFNEILESLPFFLPAKKIVDIIKGKKLEKVVCESRVSRQSECYLEDMFTMTLLLLSHGMISAEDIIDNFLNLNFYILFNKQYYIYIVEVLEDLQVEYKYNKTLNYSLYADLLKKIEEKIREEISRKIPNLTMKKRINLFVYLDELCERSSYKEISQIWYKVLNTLSESVNQDLLPPYLYYFQRANSIP